MLQSGIHFLVEQTKEELLSLYNSDARPWVIAFSGGKDSTVLLHLIYEMLLENRETVSKPVIVLCSDTGVEPPNVLTYIKKTLRSIIQHSNKHALPLNVKLIRPLPEESFWGMLIGKGYPSPTRWFRWCTSRMKIRPARKIIEKIAKEYGSVILLLGTRHDESTARKNRMEGREYSQRGLNPHHEIPNALVAAPIANWTTDQVWDFLNEENTSPWGSSHDELRELYRKATGGECHFVLDMLSPSCGGSRFGCWTCTVVKEDVSMKGFITSGENWMLPLNQFRNWLKAIREDMTMRLSYRRNGTEGPGPFSSDTRKQILTRLFEVEKKTGLTLISDKDIAYIQQIWTEEFDSRDTALAIAKAAGREVEMMNGFSLSPMRQKLLDDLLKEYEISPDLVEKLLSLVTDKYPSLGVWGAKAGLSRDIQEAIGRAIVMKSTADNSNDI
ncbi:MAG: DNA phosphorothioation system sulfurtransferase DndC [Desulfosarcina sp.]|nr:DNA phosphorothioation system sulfurtransferase DndC [Desulfosarcina sp.]MBC2743810.1 DNA phosphorothioation system sulfurtransferase DndC [Desulfosarcina sp.]MBC2766719.1 DNA phosphorothioation system sulfurtransferase DndC [Desulfosarcina sp.]